MNPSSIRDQRPSLRANLIVALVLSALVGMLLLASSRLGILPEAQDRILYDWRSYYLTRPASEQRKDISLIVINEESLIGYGSLSPINRSLLAELVRAIDAVGAKVIGLDLVIDRPTDTESHRDLISAIREVKNAKVVQATLLSSRVRRAEFDFQETFIAATRTIPAHLYFASEPNRFTLGDQAVRYRMPEGIGDPPRPSFAWAVAQAAGVSLEMPPSTLIPWLRPPVGAKDLFSTYTVRPHRDANGKRTRDPLSSGALSTLAGKIVLIGGAFTDRDRHLTPWSIASGERASGVEIHAQILSHLIDKRWIYESYWWWELPILMMTFCLGFFAAVHWRISGSGLIATIAAIVVVSFIGILLYWAGRIVLPSATIAGAWSMGLFFGSVADWTFQQLRLRGIEIF